MAPKRKWKPKNKNKRNSVTKNETPRDADVNESTIENNPKPNIKADPSVNNNCTIEQGKQTDSKEPNHKQKKDAKRKKKAEKKREQAQSVDKPSEVDSSKHNIADTKPTVAKEAVNMKDNNINDETFHERVKSAEELKIQQPAPTEVNVETTPNNIKTPNKKTSTDNTITIIPNEQEKEAPVASEHEDAAEEAEPVPIVEHKDEAPVQDEEPAPIEQQIEQQVEQQVEHQYVVEQIEETTPVENSNTPIAKEEEEGNQKVKDSPPKRKKPLKYRSQSAFTVRTRERTYSNEDNGRCLFVSSLAPSVVKEDRLQMLYEQGMHSIQMNQERYENEQKRKHDHELDGLKFAPTISANAQKLIREGELWERVLDPLGDAKRMHLMELRLARDLAAPTFSHQPEINERSKAIIALKPRKDTVTRLYENGLHSPVVKKQPTSARGSKIRSKFTTPTKSNPIRTPRKKASTAYKKKNHKTVTIDDVNGVYAYNPVSGEQEFFKFQDSPTKTRTGQKRDDLPTTPRTELKHSDETLKRVFNELDSKITGYLDMSCVEKSGSLSSEAQSIAIPVLCRVMARDGGSFKLDFAGFLKEAEAAQSTRLSPTKRLRK